MPETIFPGHSHAWGEINKNNVNRRLSGRELKPFMAMNDDETQ